jgi:hypothetical protein
LGGKCKVSQTTILEIMGYGASNKIMEGIVPLDAFQDLTPGLAVAIAAEIYAAFLLRSL